MSEGSSFYSSEDEAEERSKARAANTEAGKQSAHPSGPYQPHSTPSAPPAPHDETYRLMFQQLVANGASTAEAQAKMQSTLETLQLSVSRQTEISSEQQQINKTLSSGTTSSSIPVLKAEPKFLFKSVEQDAFEDDCFENLCWNVREKIRPPHSDHKVWWTPKVPVTTHPILAAPCLSFVSGVEVSQQAWLSLHCRTNELKIHWFSSQNCLLSTERKRRIHVENESDGFQKVDISSTLKPILDPFEFVDCLLTYSVCLRQVRAYDYTADVLLHAYHQMRYFRSTTSNTALQLKCLVNSCNTILEKNRCRARSKLPPLDFTEVETYLKSYTAKEGLAADRLYIGDPYKSVGTTLSHRTDNPSTAAGGGDSAALNPSKKRKRERGGANSRQAGFQGGQQTRPQQNFQPFQPFQPYQPYQPYQPHGPFQQQPFQQQNYQQQQFQQMPPPQQQQQQQQQPGGTPSRVALRIKRSCKPFNFSSCNAQCANVKKHYCSALLPDGSDICGSADHGQSTHPY